ncbi:hypothetical protein ScPMuIL_001484 [Solemya velum]
MNLSSLAGVLCVLLTLYNSRESHGTSSLFVTKSSSLIPSDWLSVSNTSQAKSEIHCAFQCQGTGGCKWFKYDPETLECVVHMEQTDGPHEPQQQLVFKKSPCEETWVYLGGTCYYFYAGANLLNYSEASSACVSLGGYLTELTSADETNLVGRYLTENNFPQTENYWIGGYHSEVKNGFYWEHSDTPLNYTNWFPGKLSKGNGKCVCIPWSTLKAVEWDDKTCFNEFWYICEK